MTPQAHEKWFPIGAGAVHALESPTADGPIACESCHASAAVEEVTCIGCHTHPTGPVEGHDVQAALHLDAPDYATRVPEGADVTVRSQGCVGCHPAGKRLLSKFPHGGLQPGAGSYCAVCHAPDHAFAALPQAGLVHPEVGSSDCGACHVTDTWKGASRTPQGSYDPTRDVTVDALLPAYSGTSIVSVTPDTQVVHMPMNHSARTLDGGVMADCQACHAQASLGSYYPGVMHWSLVNAGAPQPTLCVDCHATSAPVGFVGDLDPLRTPSSGPMKHDAVSWSGGAPTSTRLVTADCGACHRAPDDQVDAKWEFAFGQDDAGARFHAPLTAAGLPQPTSCVDCHANSRPVGIVTTPTMQFDHGTALDDCQACHVSTSDWSGASIHRAGGPNPSTCLPCHETERPTSVATWRGPYTTSPFDYVTNADGVKHGDGADCVLCHPGPGTGAWGASPNWQGGFFNHAPTTMAAVTCITCHSSQRPDRLTPAANAGFDHATNGASDCVGCHQATVTRGTYVNLMPIPGGDWRGGESYPGANVVTAQGQFVRLPSTALTHAGSKVTGMTTTTVTLPNGFLHTSHAIPSAVFPGDVGATNQASCWHCHTATGTTVTSFANAKFHASLTSYRATPTAAVTPLAQPTACMDCHRTMRPPNIVSRLDGGTWLQPMDHAAAFTGGAVASVTAMDCGTCHHTPGLGPTQWSDGRFHAHTPAGATPPDCVACHYPLLTLPAADVTAPGTPSDFSMKHRSGVVTTQACQSCHTGALNNAAAVPNAATQWKPGSYHATLGTAQPTTCLDCHAGSVATTATQGTVVYTLAQGGTASNGGQWMNHKDSTVAGKECATCHLADARATSPAWNEATAYHARVPGVTACGRCHGLTNGQGSVAGTNNNLPAGLIATATSTTSSASPGTKDQISHADVNVTAYDCGRCHTQVGPSTVAGVQGREWAKAKFHATFTAANPLVMNGSTGRCSNCHLNVKPGASYTQQSHAAYTATSVQDCSACHAWPGNNATTPNWLGAAGAHPSSGPTVSSTLDCGTCHGQSGSAQVKLKVANGSHYRGITNGNKCTSCHIAFSAFKGTTAVLLYGHNNSSANSGGCEGCHVFSGQLYTTLTTTPPLTYPVSAGGHTFSQSRTVSGSFRGEGFSAPHTAGSMTACGTCHPYSRTSASSNVWTFVHRPSNPGIATSKHSGGCANCH